MENILPTVDYFNPPTTTIPVFELSVITHPFPPQICFIAN